MVWDPRVRPAGAAEEIRLIEAAQLGPYVAWRDGRGELRVHALTPAAPATIGRSVEQTITIPHTQISREHAELTVKARAGTLSVHLLDRGSKHGSEHRTVRLAHGVERAAGAWRQAPRPPASAVQLAAGEHDVRLAGEHWVLVGGVPVDEEMTGDRDDALPEPTPRERDVLVELCRPFFAAPGALAAPPSNAQIAERLRPKIGPERVSDLLSQLYAKYELGGTKEQNRVLLVELARRHRLVEIDDYE